LSISESVSGSDDVGAALLAYASESAASYIVMGASDA